MFKMKSFFLPLLVKRCMAASASTRLFQYMKYCNSSVLCVLRGKHQHEYQ